MEDLAPARRGRRPRQAKGVVTILGLQAVIDAYGTTTLFRDEIDKVLRKAAEVGHRYVEARVPVRTGELKGTLAQRFLPARGDGTAPGTGPQSRVTIANLEGRKGIRYPWILNYAKSINRKAKAKADAAGEDPGRAGSGFTYARTDENGRNAGKRTLHWFSGALRPMKAYVKKAMPQVAIAVEENFARAAAKGAGA